MKRILMLEDAKGSLNGSVVTTFLKGQEYSVPEGLCNDFCSLNVAQEIVLVQAAEKAVEEAVEEVKEEKKKGKK